MPVNARRFLRKMRGGAQAHLIEADDGHSYIVKFQNNPQHRRILVNEWIGGEILRHLQIAAPESTIVAVSAEFLDANPNVYIELGKRRDRPQPGWHFGSRHPGNPETTAIYDFIPESMLNQVANREHFLGALVFDRWTANGDGRQAVFFRAQLKDWLEKPGIPPRKLGFVAMMIDHGFIFDGPNWALTESAIGGLYGRQSVYSGVRSIEDFEPWLGRVVGFPPEVLDKALRQIPQEWIAGESETLERMLEKLLARRARVQDLIYTARKAKSNPFPRWVGD